MEKSKLMKRFKKSGLIGCFDGTGINSENYKEFLDQPERSKREDSCNHDWWHKVEAGCGIPPIRCLKCGLIKD